MYKYNKIKRASRAFESYHHVVRANIRLEVMRDGMSNEMVSVISATRLFNFKELQWGTGEKERLPFGRSAAAHIALDGFLPELYDEDKQKNSYHTRRFISE